MQFRDGDRILLPNAIQICLSDRSKGETTSLGRWKRALLYLLAYLLITRRFSSHNAIVKGS